MVSAYSLCFMVEEMSLLISGAYKLLQLDEQSELFIQALIILTGGDKCFQEVKRLILRKDTM